MVLAENITLHHFIRTNLSLETYWMSDIGSDNQVTLMFDLTPQTTLMRISFARVGFGIELNDKYYNYFSLFQWISGSASKCEKSSLSK